MTLYSIQITKDVSPPFKLTLAASEVPLLLVPAGAQAHHHPNLEKKTTSVVLYAQND